jgi:hypothetical protein
MSKPKVPAPEERRAQQRRDQQLSLEGIINHIALNTDGDVLIQLVDHQSGTVLDAPGYPILWTLTVGPARPLSEPLEWNMQGQFEEVVCFLNGFQTALMLLSAMVQDQGAPPLMTGN